MAWYLVVFFFVTMTYFLVVPRSRRTVFFAMGLIAAIAAALCEIQGFVAWPVGLICLLWPTSRTRRTYYELAIWVSTAALTTALYLVGFSFHNNSCSVEGGQQGSCSFRYAVVHPVQLGRFVVVLIGNVVPVSLSAVPARYLLVFELLGSAIILSAVYVVVQSIRDRRRGVNPLPLVLIVFAFLFDLMVAASHLGEGPTAAGLNRFTMPNLILLTGIAVYACAHAPTLRKLREPVSRRDRLRTLQFAVLLALLVAQCVLATRFGITQGTVMRGGGETIGRVVVNLDRVPHAKRACYFESQVVGPPLYELQAVLGIAERNHLSVFQNSTSRHFRDMGPPILQQCVFGAGIASALLPQGIIGQPYSTTLTASGGSPPFRWAMAPVVGPLPPGLSLNVSTGVISGTPQIPGKFNFAVTVRDRAKPPAGASSPPIYPHALQIIITSH